MPIVQGVNLSTCEDRSATAPLGREGSLALACTAFSISRFAHNQATCGTSDSILDYYTSAKHRPMSLHNTTGLQK